MKKLFLAFLVLNNICLAANAAHAAARPVKVLYVSKNKVEDFEFDSNGIHVVYQNPNSEVDTIKLFGEGSAKSYTIAPHSAIVFSFSVEPGGLRTVRKKGLKEFTVYLDNGSTFGFCKSSEVPLSPELKFLMQKLKEKFECVGLAPFSNEQLRFDLKGSI